jgi:hypothetical protein
MDLDEAMSTHSVDVNVDNDGAMRSVGFYEHTEAPYVFPSFDFFQIDLYTDQDVETPCMICGVSFNISRHRTNGEPPSAAWCSHAKAGIGELPGSQSCAQPGCTSIPRNGPEPETRFISTRNLYSSRSEHVSGPNCTSINAYHGNRISAEAMRECNTYQCLLSRNETWEPQESELEDFEKQGRFVLSGISGCMEPDYRSYSEVFPRRNNVRAPETDYDDDGVSAMPVHPTCFEVFKRASIYRYGFADVEALARWGQGRNALGMPIPEHAAVKRGREMYWRHHIGDEFLAANPCFVPGLQDILVSVQNTSNPDDSCSDEALSMAHSTDVFSKLPQEIKLEILLRLDSWDIANLRRSSRSFRHLPQSLFYHLTLRELPWLYEAWSSLPLSFFVTTTAAEQTEIGQTLVKTNDEISSARLNDSGSEEDAAKIERLVRFANELQEKQKHRYTTPVGMLDRKNTNWTRLRGELTRRWGELPGLRNRRRIWNSCQEIMDRAEVIAR